MNMPENTVGGLSRYFHQKLKDHFDKGEINSLFSIAMEHYFGYSRPDLRLKSEERLTESEILKFVNLVRKLRQDIPLAYILGETEFMGLTVITNPSVLIPRPETEELVDMIVKDNVLGKPRILDIGTGSGCIALALKKLIPKAEVFGMDFSEKALKTASENAKRNDLRVNFIRDDILAPEKDYPQFDIIVSNPPYVTESERAMMSPSVKDHEPGSALFVPDDDPFVFYKAICSFAERQLKPQGYLYFETNQYNAVNLVDIIDNQVFNNIELKKDINDNYRMIRARKRAQ